jgi:hypothetical protein
VPAIFTYNCEERKRALIRRWFTPGKASDFIHHAPDVVGRGDPVVLRLRVSSYVQAKNKNLDDHEDRMRRAAEQLGAVVVGVDRHVGPGWDVSSIAAAAAMARKHNAKILAESTDRFIRNPLYSKHRQWLRPRTVDLQELRFWTEGIVLATILPPDASSSDVRSSQCKRGQAAKGRKGGRPPERRWKARRLARLEAARKMRDDGLSYREIAARLNAMNDGFPDVTGMTIHNWLNTTRFSLGKQVIPSVQSYLQTPAETISNVIAHLPHALTE